MAMLVIIAAQTCRTQSAGQAARARGSHIPLLFRQEKFNAAMLADAVNYYIAIGEKETIHQLTMLDPDPTKDHRGRIYLTERIDWVCRILFQPKNNKAISVSVGEIDGPYSAFLYKKWPLYPVIHSGNSYFVMGPTWVFPEDQFIKAAYFGDFQNLGKFRRVSVPIPTQSEAVHDLKLLRRSRTWRMVQWRTDDSLPIDKEMETRVWYYLKQQATTIPYQKY